MTTLDEGSTFRSRLPISPKWEKLVEADEKVPSFAQTRRKYALNALLSVSAFTSMGLAVSERCVEHGVWPFLVSFVFWYLMFMVTVALCELGIGESNQNLHHHKIFNDISKITSGVGSLLSCGFFLRFAEHFLRNALAISAGAIVLFKNVSPRTLCPTEGQCFTLSGRPNCSSKIPIPYINEECQKLTVNSVLFPPTLRLTEMMSAIDYYLFTNPIPSWMVLVVVIATCFLGLTLRSLIVSFSKIFFFLMLFFQIILAAVLSTSVLLLNPWPSISFFAKDFHVVRFCFDGVAIATSALWLGSGLFVEFGTVMPAENVSKLKGLGIALISLLYTSLIGLLASNSYLAESQSIMNNNEDPMLIWPIWTKFESHGNFMVIVIAATLLLFLLGTLSTVTLLLFYPLSGSNKSSFLKFYGKLVTAGLVIALVSLGGVRAMRVVERSADFITSIAILLQMIILIIARATGGRVFNRQITEGSNVFGTRRGWRQALVPFNLGLSFLLSLLIFVTAVWRVIEPVPPGVWQKTLDPISHFIAEVPIHLLPVFIFLSVTGIRILVLSRSWSRGFAYMNLNTIVSDYG